MVEVSENFKKLAQENGRHVYCKIDVGGVTFLDDRILEFTMDDVTHPDWFTIGTACANRFHFRALYDGTFDTGTQVVPYISFDNEEWCCLGMFYISRRYVRGNTISLTAYDRMYSLDMEYETQLSVPCTASALLEDICTRYDIPLPDSGADFTVETLPECCTVRDMIGFIAGLNRACAKFDRQGQLMLRQCSQLGYVISDANCMDIQRNMEESCMTCFKVQTDSELLVAGEGAEIATIETYNPLMTQTRLDRISEMLDGYCFYGADIFMQGLPYLESGESVLLADGVMLYRIVISEMELHYDGTLTAVIYSRNKSYADAVVHEDDLELALEQLKSSLCAEAQTLVNDEQIQISEAPVTLAQFDFNAPANGFAELSLNISISEDTADAVKFSILLNGAELPRSIIHNLEANSGRNLVQVEHLQKALPQGSNQLSVVALTGNGSCFILPSAMQAGLVVYGTNSASAAVVTTDGAPLTSYSILSDTSVQCNGRRYDIETDSTGLISRITDDLGGVLVPENVAAPADLALHNAVLWAVAISKGLASPQPSGEYVYICTDYDAEKKLWTNQSGAPPLDLSAAVVNSDGIHGNVWWTVPVIPNPLGQFTFYAVARAADFDNLTGNWMNVIANEGATPQYNLTVRHKKWSIGTDEDTGYHWGDTYATEWRVLAVRRNGAVGEFYVDDSLQHSLSYCHPQIGDVDENFQINGVDFKFRYIGIFNEYHDDATLKAKIAELQQTYYTELPAVNDWKLLQSSSSGSYKTSETLSGAIPHSDTGYAMLVVSTRYELSLSDDSWELLTQSAVTNEGVAGLAKQSFFVYIKPLSEFDGSNYSVTVNSTRFIWASLSYFTDAAKISVAHTSALSAQSWVTPAKTEPTKRLYLVTVTHEVTPSLQSAVDGTNISYIARTNTTRALMAYDYKPDMMSPLNIDTADSTSGQDCRAVLVLDIE